jgi:hypothetical protein
MMFLMILFQDLIRPGCDCSSREAKEDFLNDGRMQGRIMINHFYLKMKVLEPKRRAAGVSRLQRSICHKHLWF